MTALVAATTANVLDKTEKMLVSLAACRDRFDLLVLPIGHHLLWAMMAMTPADCFRCIARVNDKKGHNIRTTYGCWTWCH